MDRNPKSPLAKHSTPADTSAAVDSLMLGLEHPAKGTIQALREAILAADPSIREGVKWNSPSFRTGEYFATVHLRAKSGVTLILHFGAKARELAAGRETIADPSGLLTWLARDRASVNFQDAADLAARTKPFKAILRQWITQI